MINKFSHAAIRGVKKWKYLGWKKKTFDTIKKEDSAAERGRIKWKKKSFENQNASFSIRK